MNTRQDQYNKPLPPMNTWSKPFWDSVNNRKPLVRKCQSGHIHLPFHSTCTKCPSDKHDWVNLTGTGTIYSMAIYYQLWHSGWTNEIPYNTVLVDLDEGVQVPGDIVAIKNDDIDVGMRVEMVFEDILPGITIWHFKPIEPLQFATHPLGRAHNYEERPKPNHPITGQMLDQK